MAALATVAAPAVPPVGFGTAHLSAGPAAAQAVASALQCGYRWIDTAPMYGNEASVGQAVRESAVARAEIVVVTKIPPAAMGPKTAESARQSLETLGLEYVDVMLLHWPGTANVDSQSPVNRANRATSYRILQALQREGRVRAIGVSNFLPRHLAELAEDLGSDYANPLLNQFERHPLCQNRDVVSYCAEKGIAVQSYSPLGQGRLLAHPAVLRVAAETGASAAAVLLGWARAHDTPVIAKAASAEHMEENLRAASAPPLPPEAVAALDALNADGDQPFFWCPRRVA